MKRSNFCEKFGTTSILAISMLTSTVSLAYNGEPRDLPSQGIDVNNSVVASHTTIYNTLLEELDISNTPNDANITLNPYGTAPLSAYYGVWNEGDIASINVSVTSANGLTIDKTYIPALGANLLPVTGLEANKENVLKVTTTNSRDMEYNYGFTITTDPLPPTDADTVDGKSVYFGTPIFTVKTFEPDLSLRSDGVYITSFFGRGHYAIDDYGDLRWFLKNDVIPSFNFVSLGNGHYLSEGYINASDPNTVPEDYKALYEWDWMGRVHTVYNISYKAHHSSELLDGDPTKLIYASENSQPGEENVTREDGIAVLDLKTGNELHYYDMTLVLDESRYHQPKNSDGDPRIDWAHLNKTYYIDNQNMIVSSLRHQNALVGMYPNDNKAQEPTIAFIAGSHFDWSEKYQDYLLTPIDTNGDELYNLSTPQGVESADKEFWTWGQHGVVPLPNSDTNLVKFAVFDNGNFRSNNIDDPENLSQNPLVPADNWSSYVEFTIDLTNKTIVKGDEYGKEEFGAYYYSSLVGSVYKDPENGNVLVNFGGAILDGNDIPTTIDVGNGSDIIDPNTDNIAKGHPSIVEAKRNPDGTFTTLFELEVTSGRPKTPDDGPANNASAYRYDLTQFYVLKKPMYD